MQWPDGEEIDLTLNIDESVNVQVPRTAHLMSIYTFCSEELSRKYPGLQKDWSQQTYLVVGQLMSKLSGRDVIDNTTFRR